MFTAPRRPDLANEPVGRLMLRLSIPTITAQLVNMLYNLVDRIYISYIPDVGTLALTGLGVCLPIILLVSAFAALCASSGAPLASIAMGQRNNEKAEGILGSCTALLLCVSAVLTVILSCFTRRFCWRSAQRRMPCPTPSATLPFTASARCSCSCLSA